MNRFLRPALLALVSLAFSATAFAQSVIILEIAEGQYVGMATTADGKQFALTNIVIRKLKVTPPNPSEGLAAQLIVLRDQMTATTKTVAVLLDLQEKYQKGAKPEMFLLDRTEPSTITTTFMKLKPASAAFPYFFLVDKGGKVLHHGPILTTTEENVTLIQKYQEKQPP